MQAQPAPLPAPTYVIEALLAAQASLDWRQAEAARYLDYALDAARRGDLAWAAGRVRAAARAARLPERRSPGGAVLPSAIDTAGRMLWAAVTSGTR